jgi:hypothetical protein
MCHLFVNFGSRQKGVLPPITSTRRAVTHTASACAAPFHCPRASKLGFEPSCSGHDEGHGIDDHSCRRRRHRCRHCRRRRCRRRRCRCRRCCHCRRRRHCCRTGGGKTANNEEGACHCYHVSGRRAEEGRGAVVPAGRHQLSSKFLFIVLFS